MNLFFDVLWDTKSFLSQRNMLKLLFTKAGFERMSYNLKLPKCISTQLIGENTVPLVIFLLFKKQVTQLTSWIANAIDYKFKDKFKIVKQTAHNLATIPLEI